MQVEPAPEALARSRRTDHTRTPLTAIDEYLRLVLPPELDATMTVSDREQLQTMDFEQMSAAQITDAKAEIRRLHLPLDLRRTRRLRPDLSRDEDECFVVKPDGNGGSPDAVLARTGLSPRARNGLYSCG